MYIIYYCSNTYRTFRFDSSVVPKLLLFILDESGYQIITDKNLNQKTIIM